MDETFGIFPLSLIAVTMHSIVFSGFPRGSHPPHNGELMEIVRLSEEISEIPRNDGAEG